MKKIVLLVTLLVTLCFSAVCLAAGNASVLGKEEKAINNLISAFKVEQAAEYSNVAKSFSPALSQKITAEAFSGLQKEVQEKFGELIEMKLATLEKFDQADRLTYLSSYSKQKLVKLVFVFDTTGSKPLLNDFAFTTVEVPQNSAAENK